MSGVYRTDDRGASFHALGDVTHVDHVSVDFADPQRQTMLAGGHESSSLWLSTDGGDTWRDVGVGLPDDVGFASSPHIVDATTFLLGTNSAGRGPRHLPHHRQRRDVDEGRTTVASSARRSSATAPSPGSSRTAAASSTSSDGWR